MKKEKQNRMEEMKVSVKWVGDPYWMNPDNLLIALRSYCPNAEFKCEYLIHPSKDKSKNFYKKLTKKYERRQRKLDKKCFRDLKRRKDT